MRTLERLSMGALALCVLLGSATPLPQRPSGDVNSQVLPEITNIASNFTAVVYSGTSTDCDTPAQEEYHVTGPEAVDIDSTKLKTALAYASVDGSSSIKIFRNGCLIGQGFRDKFDDRVPSLNAGQTKAVVALIAGIVADQGWIDLDVPIDGYIEPGLGNAAHRSRTIRQFMNLVSGVEVNHVSGLNFFGDISRAREYFATPLSHPAGAYYEFDEITPSVVTYCLERAIQQFTGTDMDFQKFAQMALFDPLGIPTNSYFWQKDRSGVTTGYSGLWLRPLEYARMGLMLANNGTFGGCRILSNKYVQSMREGSKANCGFGLYMWLNSCKRGQTQVNTDYPSRQILPGEEWIQSAPNDLYYSLGLGTNTFIIPSLNMVITRDGYQELDTLPGAVNGDVHGAFPGNAGGPGDHEFFRLLMRAVKNMPVGVRATIQNSGPYDRPRDERIDVAPFVRPLSAPLGSYTAVGPEGPEGCTALRCRSSSNDGLTWLGQVPRTIPGLVNLGSRPSTCPASSEGQQFNSVDHPNIQVFGIPKFDTKP